MPDVGVLNLQIHENSSQAEQGLQKLADALFRVKRAVNGGLKLANIATQLQKIANVVDNNISGSTISKLAEFGDSLARLKGLGDVRISIRTTNLDGTIRAVQDGKRTIEEMGESMQETTNSFAEGFGEVAQVPIDAIGNLKELDGELRKTEDTINEVKNTATGLDFSVFDPANLPLGALGMKLNDNAQEWHQWGKAVAETFEDVRQMGSRQLLNDFYNHSNDSAGKVTAFGSIEEAAKALGITVEEAQAKVRLLKDELHDNTGMVRGFSSIEEAAEALGITVDEARQKVVHMYEDSISEAIKLSREIGQKYDNVIYREQTTIAGNLSRFAAALRGDLGEKEQFYAIQAEASHTGETIEEVSKRIEKAMFPINAMRERIRELFETLEKEPKINLAESINRQMNIDGPIINAQKSAEVLQACITETERQIDELIEKLNQPININWADAIDQMQGLKSAAKSADDSLSVFLNAMAYEDSPAADKIRELNPEMNDLAEQLRETGQIASGETLSSLVDLDGELKQKKKDTDDACGAFERFKNGLGHIKDGVKGLFPHLTKLGKQFVSIARRMMIRSIIKQFTGGLQEGLQNVYQYSKLVGTGFAPAMDSAASSLLQMKNSIGAALAPAIQALIPLLQSVVNWVISVINYFNQFFALLNGQKTWTRALPATTTAFGKQEKAAKKTGSAIKDLLADWDELNIIQSQTSGAGGLGDNSEAEQYLKMFEEVSTFDNKIKDIVNFIKDNFDIIKDTALAIGAAILAWKFSSAFLGDISGLTKIGLALEVAGIALTIGTAIRGGTNGFYTDEDTGELIAGICAMGLGGAALGWKVGGLWGALAGFTMGIGVGLYGQAFSFKAAADAELEKIYWGSREYTKADVQKWVEDQFKFPVVMETNAIMVRVRTLQSSKEAVKADIKTFLEKEKIANVKFGLSADDKEDALKEAVESASKVCETIATQMKEQQIGIAAMLKLNPLEVDGKDESENFLENLIIADQPVISYFEDIGKRLSQALIDGEKAGLKLSENTLALELLASQRRILEKWEEYNADYDMEKALKGSFDFDLADEESTQAAIDYQKQVIDDYVAARLAERQETIDTINKSKNLAQSILDEELDKQKNGLEFNADLIAEMQNSIALYEEELMTLANEDINAQIEAKLASTKDWLKQLWIQKIGGTNGAAESLIDMVMGRRFSFNKNEHYLGSMSDDQIIAEIGNAISEAYSKAQDDPIFKKAVEQYGITPNDMFFESVIDELLWSLTDVFGDTGETAERIAGILKSMPEYAKYAEQIDAAMEEERRRIGEIVLPRKEYEKEQAAKKAEIVEENLHASGIESEFAQFIDDTYKELSDKYGIESSETVNLLKQAVDQWIQDNNSIINGYHDIFYDIYLQKREEERSLEGIDYNPSAVPAYQYTKDNDVWPGKEDEYPMSYDPTKYKEDTSEAVKNGTKSANSELEGLSRDMLTELQKMNRKEWTININPTARWGIFGQRSAEAAEAVTGNGP